MFKMLCITIGLLLFGLSAAQAQVFTPPEPLYPVPYTCYDATDNLLYDLGMVGAMNTRNNAIFYDSTDGSCLGNYYTSITIVSAQSEGAAWSTCVTTLGYFYFGGGPYVIQINITSGHENMPADLYFCYF